MSAEHINLSAEQMASLREMKKRSGGIIAVVVALVLLMTSWFTIEPEEVGVILRFGAYNRTVEPGLNLKIPFGVEKVFKVPVERQLKEEFGFRTKKAGVNTRYSNENFANEALMMTGDLNLASVEWIVQYRIADPFKFLFRVRNPQRTLRDMTEAVARQIVGDRTVTEVLTIGRQEITVAIEAQLQELCNSYETGIKIEQVVLQDVNPPDRVKPAFNEVNEAQQEREKLINEARSAYNQVIPRARGEAEQTLQQAEGYALDRVNRSKGEASRFNSLYGEYRKAPQVTKRRLYLETMNTVMQQSGKKVVIDDKLEGVLPLMLFDDKAGSIMKGGQK